MKNDPGKMPRSTGGAPEKQGGPKAHPNGGGARPMPKPSGKVGRTVGGAPESGAPLDVGQGSDSGLGKMPRTSSGQRQYIPHRS